MPAKTPSWPLIISGAALGAGGVLVLGAVAHRYLLGDDWDWAGRASSAGSLFLVCVAVGALRRSSWWVRWERMARRRDATWAEWEGRPERRDDE